LSDSEGIACVDGGPEPALLREVLLQKGRRVVVRVSSTSMLPTLRAGDRVTVEGIEPARLRCGDIVVYESPLAGLVVHRLLWKIHPFAVPEEVYTKGDALPYLDRPSPARGVLGRVIVIEGERGRRKVRRTTGYLQWVLAAARWGLRRGVGRIGRTALTHGENR
jgi:signal peptidase I